MSHAVCHELCSQTCPMQCDDLCSQTCPLLSSCELLCTAFSCGSLGQKVFFWCWVEFRHEAATWTETEVKEEPVDPTGREVADGGDEDEATHETYEGGWESKWDFDDEWGDHGGPAVSFGVAECSAWGHDDQGQEDSWSEKDEKSKGWHCKAWHSSPKHSHASSSSSNQGRYVKGGWLDSSGRFWPILVMLS